MVALIILPVDGGNIYGPKIVISNIHYAGCVGMFMALFCEVGTNAQVLNVNHYCS